ncbi:aminocarboxymuconate-semialdehyde decarboxylase [Roridomyces roridus]|uniref:6-methylsalicylate decarboxylase n=1 Tax=Roridomyces roridus TaxID=1738132 RepID=A0AAD7FW45_9AGAR|nr:aminocarboxymuconate-semialdehyde decarboxylase [Roridomyces roridus]
MESSPKIDVHTHYLTPAYVQALKDAGQFPGPDGLPFTPTWNPDDHLAFMEKNNISKSILSCSQRHLGREVTREVNVYAADLKLKYPSKFGFFASLPLPDIAGSLLEIDYALDELNADGFVLLSNFHGIYMGDPQLSPIYAKLQERRATVFVHPTAPCIARTCNHDVRSSAPLADAYMIPIMEYLFDSTRTFVDLLLSGTAAAHPDVNFIVPHCGSALPSLLDRMVVSSSWDSDGFVSTRGPIQPITASFVKELFAKQFYFDLAGVAMANQIHHMLRWVGTERFLYGSDVPWTPWAGAEKRLKEIEEELPKLFGEQEIRDICYGNALKLLAM